MSTKALFFDIDGTLVSFRTHVIPQSAVDALSRAKEQGIMIFISTGRPVPFIVNLKQIAHLIDGYITTNGAHCFIGQKTVSCHSIGKDDIGRVLDQCRQWDAPCIVVGKDHIGVFNPKPVIEAAFQQGLGLEDFRFTPLETVLSEPVLQLTPFISTGQEAELMPTLSACTSGRWTPVFTDITHVKADKGKALLSMAAFLDLNIDETMAFGDGGNDISIIRQAGIGVAMGNAGDEVKQHADFVTASVDEDGVKLALERFLD